MSLALTDLRPIQIPSPRKRREAVGIKTEESNTSFRGIYSFLGVWELNSKESCGPSSSDNWEPWSPLSSSGLYFMLLIQYRWMLRLLLLNELENPSHWYSEWSELDKKEWIRESLNLRGGSIVRRKNGPEKIIHSRSLPRTIVLTIRGISTAQSSHTFLP